jgi:hypothetical protein
VTDQILLNKPYAESRVISPKHPVPDEVDQALRIYRDSPFTITLQVRTRTGKQKRISQCTVTKQQAKDIAAYLLRVAEGLSDQY